MEKLGMKCPVCSSNGSNGALCSDHALMTKDYDWLRGYINGQEKVSEKLVYILEFGISDRVSFIINDIPIENGKLKIMETLQNSKCSLYKKRILTEIIMLEKAKKMVLDMLEMEVE